MQNYADGEGLLGSKIRTHNTKQIYLSVKLKSKTTALVITNKYMAQRSNNTSFMRNSPSNVSVFSVTVTLSSLVRVMSWNYKEEFIRFTRTQQHMKHCSQ